MILACTLAACTAHADPVLDIRRIGNQIELKWPAVYLDWYVQASPSLKPDSWEPIFEKRFIVIDTLYVKLPMVGKARFFRLAKNDAPDDNYTDENGDGIDGDVNRAIFVTATGGHDNNPGTPALPMATLQAAIGKASTQNKDVYVGKGTYATSDLLVLSSGVNLYGQYDPANNWKRAAGNTTTISGGATAIVAQNISAPVTVEGFTIRSANATLAGSSSYGVRVLSSSSTVTLRRNLIIAGNGAAGTAGGDGTKGADGGNGGSGGGGYPDNENLSGAGGAAGTSPVGRTGGKGGKGGLAPSYWGSVGSLGSTGASGGAGGMGGSPGRNGKAGEDGAHGAAGAAASGGGAFGSLGVGGYVPAAGADALAGTHGHGGGGGGGGGGQDCAFCDNGGGNGGGGGGGGAQAGTGGKGGKGGGGSFGVLSYNSNLQIQVCTIHTGNGGAGGKGGNGGPGGEGGFPGLGEAVGMGELGLGAHGGFGGNGGAGGNGGGGGGGPSIGISVSGGSWTIHNVAYEIGQGGPGGAGGNNGNASNPGSPGTTAQRP